MPDKKIKIVVEVDGKKYRADLGKVSKDTEKFAGKQKNVAAATSQLNGVLKTAVGLFAAYKLGSIIKDSILLAARTETLGVVLGVVGRNIGVTREEMLAYAQGVKEMGITTEASRTTVVRMAQAHLDLAKSSELARVAQDAAVVGNINSSEALTRLIHGITTLQPEILRTIGLSITFEQEYARVAKQTNRTADSFTQAEKKNIALNAVLRESKTIAGAYEGAMETAGKQMQSLDRHAKAAQEQLGMLFQPAFRSAISTTTSLLKSMTETFKELNILAGTADLDTLLARRTFLEGQEDAGGAGVATHAGGGSRRSGQTVLQREIAQISELIKLKQIEKETTEGLRLKLSQLQQQRASLSTGGAGFAGQSNRRSASALDAEIEATRSKLRGLEFEFENAKALAARTFAEITGAGPTSGLDPKVVQLIADLEKQIALYGEVSETASLRYELEQGSLQNLLPAVKERLELLADQRDAQIAATEAAEKQVEADEKAAAAAERLAEAEAQRIKMLKDEGLRVWEATRTAGERLAIEMERLGRLYQANDFDLDTFTRAARDAEEEFIRLTDKTKETGDEMNQFAIQAARNIQSAFADFLFDPFEEGLQGMFDSFVDTLRRMAAEIVAQQALTALFPDFFPSGTTTTLAKGGVMTASGQMPLRRYAHGGVATSPQLAIFGEGSQNEAFVPLPDGKRIPVQMKGAGGSQPIRVEIVNQGTPQRIENSNATFDATGAVVRIIVDDLNRGGPIDNKLTQTGRGRSN